MSDDLLKNAVADREARPWNYYRLDHETTQRIMNQLADKLAGAESAIREYAQIREGLERDLDEERRTSRALRCISFLESPSLAVCAVCHGEPKHHIYDAILKQLDAMRDLADRGWKAEAQAKAEKEALKARVAAFVDEHYGEDWTTNDTVSAGQLRALLQG